MLDIVKRAEMHCGDPVALRSYREQKLYSEVIEKLEDYLDAHPNAINIQLASVVGNKIAPGTVSNYMSSLVPTRVHPCSPVLTCAHLCSSVLTCPTFATRAHL